MIEEKDLGNWSQTLLVIKGVGVASGHVECGPAVFLPGHVLLRVCEWLNSEQVFCNLRLLNTGFVLLA